jgi:hypothetical protein
MLKRLKYGRYNGYFDSFLGVKEGAGSMAIIGLTRKGVVSIILPKVHRALFILLMNYIAELKRRWTA